jgi:signal transduction protein with GAF and PtsI domain
MPVSYIMDNLMSVEELPVDFLHEIGGRREMAGDFQEVLDRVVEFACGVVKCDSCLIYVLEGEDLVLRASRNTHPSVAERLKLPAERGITGWVAEHHDPVAVSNRAVQDPRFQFFHELPENSYEAFLSVPLMCRGRVVGAINLLHRLPHVYKRKEIRVISAVGFLIGAEIELTRMEAVNAELGEQLRTRKVVERAKGILQRELGWNEEQAYLALQKQSRQKRRAMKDIAEAIILGEEVRRDRLPDGNRVNGRGKLAFRYTAPCAPVRVPAEMRLVSGDAAGDEA